MSAFVIPAEAGIQRRYMFNDAKMSLDAGSSPA